MKIPMSVAILLGAQLVASEPRPLTNEDIVRLAEAGFGNSVILAKIEGTTANFDVTIDALVALKERGVGEDVVAAMIVSSRETPARDAHEVGKLTSRPSTPITLEDVSALAQTWSDALLAIHTAASAATVTHQPLVISQQVSAMVDHADLLLKHASPRPECNDIARRLKSQLVSARNTYADAADSEGKQRVKAMNDASEAVVAAGSTLRSVAGELCPFPQSLVDLLGKRTVDEGAAQR